MKSRKSAILLAATAIALSICLLVGATYALFGQKTDRTVEVTSGGVSAEVEFEESVKTYSMGEITATAGTFELGGTAALDDNNVLVMSGVMPGDKAEIVLYIKNTSSIKIKYRVDAMLGGELAAVFVVTVDGKAVNASEDHTAITGWTELEVEGIKKLAVTVELPASAGNEFMKKSGEAKISVRIGQGNASDEELDNAFSKES